jgi:hypothetical protein
MGQFPGLTTRNRNKPAKDEAPTAQASAAVSRAMAF